MTLNTMLAFAAAAASAGLGSVSLLGKGRTVTHWSFFAGTLLLSAQSILDGLSMGTDEPYEIVRWQTLALGVKSCLPVAWIYFSLVYSRGNYREFLQRWKLLLLAAGLLPVGWLALLLFRLAPIGVAEATDSHSGWWIVCSNGGRALIALLLMADALVLANLEKTFRSAVGAMQWRIKFMVLGLGVIFGVKIYTQSQALLYSGHDLTLLGVDAGALLCGCALITLAYLRHGFSSIDVYPSRAVLQSSVTVLLVGSYLFIVGALAHIAARLGEARNFQAQVLVVLLGMVVLVVLLFSARLRQRVGRFVSRHFQRPQHDFRSVWTLLTRRMFEARDEAALCAAAAKLIAETFRVLSVTFWVADERGEQLLFVASTSPVARATANAQVGGRLPGTGFLDDVITSPGAHGQPFDLEKAPSAWAETLRRANPPQFATGGNRLAVPLTIGERRLGVAVLADRVNGVPYTAEELDLLGCIGDQLAAGLLNLRLTGDLMQAKELEAFQTMSTFFVHDLKNATYSLGLMLENLPVHFDDPAFRADALRGIGSTVARINFLIERLSSLRRKLEAKPMPLDLNGLVEQTLDALPEAPAGVEVRRDLRPLPEVSADREQIESVLTNLVLNARDALEHRSGCVRVETHQHDGQAVLTVADDGSGMSAEFLRDSLFRPFHTTKKKGLGIGMFQSKMLVEANRGTIRVTSEVGKGTTFRVTLPLATSAL